MWRSHCQAGFVNIKHIDHAFICTRTYLCCKDSYHVEWLTATCSRPGYNKISQLCFPISKLLTLNNVLCTFLNSNSWSLSPRFEFLGIIFYWLWTSLHGHTFYRCSFVTSHLQTEDFGEPLGVGVFIIYFFIQNALQRQDLRSLAAFDIERGRGLRTKPLGKQRLYSFMTEYCGKKVMNEVTIRTKSVSCQRL